METVGSRQEDAQTKSRRKRQGHGLKGRGHDTWVIQEKGVEVDQSENEETRSFAGGPADKKVDQCATPYELGGLSD